MTELLLLLVLLAGSPQQLWRVRGVEIGTDCFNCARDRDKTSACMSKEAAEKLKATNDKDEEKPNFTHWRWTVEKCRTTKKIPEREGSGR